MALALLPSYDTPTALRNPARRDRLRTSAAAEEVDRQSGGGKGAVGAGLVGGVPRAQELDADDDFLAETEVELSAQGGNVVGAVRGSGREGGVLVLARLGEKASADMEAEVADQRSPDPVVLEIGV